VVDIIFHVTEKQTGSINFGTVFGGGAYGDNRSRIAGFLGYQQPNLFGQGKNANLRAEYGYGRSTLEASYTDPALWGTRNSGSVSLFRSGDRFVRFGNGRRLRTGGSLQFGMPVPGSLRTRAFLGYSLSRTEYSSVEEQCDLGSTSIFCLPNATASTLSLGITRDTKNHPLFPTAGTRQTLSAEQTGGPLGGDGNYQKLFAQAEWWVPTGRLGSGAARPTMALGLSARAGAIFGDVGPLPLRALLRRRGDVRAAAARLPGVVDRPARVQHPVQQPARAAVPGRRLLHRHRRVRAAADRRALRSPPSATRGTCSGAWASSTRRGSSAAPASA
jgi:outer membrane protein insertion porin family